MSDFRVLQNQEGVVLLVAIMLLALLSVMGLAAISTTSTELQLASNEQADAQAFHSAEAGIREVLYRSTLADLQAVSIAGGGRMAEADGTIFDAAIADPGIGGIPDPDWTTNIYFASESPPSSGSIINSRTILPASNWSRLAYSHPDAPLTVRYLRESDLKDWGVIPFDLNQDGDEFDLVYYNGSGLKPQRVGAGTAAAGLADATPPAELTRDSAVRLITSTGRSGKTSKWVRLEIVGFSVNPSVVAPLVSGVPVKLGGSGIVSGFNHDSGTRRSDRSSVNAGLYDHNGCNNYSGAAGTGGCGMSPDPESNCPANSPCNADYSGMALSEGHRPAIHSPGDPVLKGRFKGWGGTDDNSMGWKRIDASIFPTLAALLNLDDDRVGQLLAGANADPSSCPGGVTYINNKGGADYKPSDNCSQGQGLLIVTGNLKISGSFEFRGLVYVEGQAELSGNSWLLGALLVRGKQDGNEMVTGNATVLFSRPMIEQVFRQVVIQAGVPFVTLSWREG